MQQRRGMASRCKALRGPFDVIVSHHPWSGADAGKIDGWIAEVRDYARQFPYGASFCTAFWPGGGRSLLRPTAIVGPRSAAGPRLDARPNLWRGETVLKRPCHFWVQVGHGCDPAPGSRHRRGDARSRAACVAGVVSAEDEQLEDVPTTSSITSSRILDLFCSSGNALSRAARTSGGPLARLTQGCARFIFNGRYRSVLLPSVRGQQLPQRGSESRGTGRLVAGRPGGRLGQPLQRRLVLRQRAWEWEYRDDRPSTASLLRSQRMLVRGSHDARRRRVSRPAGGLASGAEAPQLFCTSLEKASSRRHAEIN